MRFSIIFLVVLTIACSSTKAAELECEFSIDSEYGYQCNVLSLNLTSEDRVITSVRVAGEHLAGKSNDDVKYFNSVEKTLHYFPRGITTFFKNIDKLHAYLGDIKEITKEDLEQFDNKLTRLWLPVNSIKYIPADLFEFSSNLEEISLFNSDIIQVDSGAFDGLAKLTTLFLNNNHCTSDDEKADDDRTKVLQLIRYVKKTCQHKHYNLTVDAKEKSCIAEVREENENLKAKLNETLKELEGKDGEIEDLKKENSKLVKDISRLEAEVKDMKENDGKLNEIVEILKNDVVGKMLAFETKFDQELSSISTKIEKSNH